MDNYKIVFSIFDSGYINWYLLLSLFFAFIVAMGVFAVKESLIQRLFAILILLYGVYWVIDMEIDSYLNIAKLKKIYTNKKYKELVGKIYNFKENKIKAGYVIYTFNINNVEFKYSNIEINGGYNKTKSEGSILENNQTVKIRYVNKVAYDTKNLILYLEVCKK